MTLPALSSCSTPAEQRSETEEIYMYGLPSNRITKAIRLEFGFDGLLERAEVRTVDQFTPEQILQVEFDSLELERSAVIGKTGATIGIEVNRLLREEQISASFVTNADGSVEISLPDRPEDSARIEFDPSEREAAYSFNGREVLSFRLGDDTAIRERQGRLRYLYARDWSGGDAGEVQWLGIDEITAIQHTADDQISQILFEYLDGESVPFWYQFVYTALPPVMDFRTAVINDFLISYALGYAFHEPVFTLLAVSIVPL